jgi:nitrogen fixation protein FixH
MTVGWDPTQRRSAWRFFPLAVIVAMAVVVAVNVGMAWSAIRTFPGTAVNDTFDHSNEYDKVLNAAARQAALGWSLQLTLQSGVPVATLTDRNGRPVEGVRMTAIAQRPLGAEEASDIAFKPDGRGRYAGARALTPPGQWDLLFTASVGERHFHATRRVVVP